MSVVKRMVGVACSLAAVLCADSHEGPHCREADRVIKEFAAKMRAECGLTLTGFGGQMPHEIRSLELSFSSHEPVEPQAARSLYLQLVREFVSTVNRDRSIRPFLADYPITARQVELVLSLQDEQGRMKRDGSLCMILNVPEIDRVIYHRFDKDRLVSMREEPLEEALATR